MPKQSFSGASKKDRTSFLHHDFFSLSLDWCLYCYIIQIFLKKCFTRRTPPFFLFSLVNYSQLCSFRPMHTQFRSFLQDLKSFDQVKKQLCCVHRIVVGLKFKLPTRQKKEKKSGAFFKILIGKTFKTVCRNKVLLVFKNVQNLFFYTKISSLFFRVMSLVSHHPAFLDILFYKKSSALFLVFCGELFPIVFI